MNDKLDLQTPDFVNENIEKLAALFPQCVTESAEGKKIDFDLLQQELSHNIVEGNRERYRLEWPGKREAIVTANLPTTKTLRPVREDSVDFDNTENLYIEGDNLEVLKLLQESYFGKIKMIYIDPPYNTGNDFVYRDNFDKDKETELFESGQIDEQQQRLVANPETSGRYHSDWLTMMYPRLKLARNLLTDDGVIFISIDDNEVHNLRKVCEEVFGEGNFVAQITIASNSSKNNSKYISVTHEYALCFAKIKQNLGEDWFVSRNNLDEYKNRVSTLINSKLPYDKIRKELLALTKYPRFYEFDHYTYVDKRGAFRASDLTAPSSKNFYDVIHPKTKLTCKTGIRGWAYSQEAMQKLIDDDRILWGENETIMPQLKNYLFENEKTLPKSVLFFDSQSSTKWLKAENLPFDFAKSIDLIKYFFETSVKNNDIILDFFSGSATTAHAVMQLNAEDGGNRKYIMVQLPEQTDENSEAYKAGYKNICEIGKERIRRASKAIVNGQLSMLNDNNGKLSIVKGQLEEENSKLIKDENKIEQLQNEINELQEKINNLQLTINHSDNGFRVYQLANSNMQDVYYRPQDYKQENLDLFADNIKPDRTPDDLLAQVMLDWGLPLSYKIEQQTINGKQVFKVAQDSLLACFDKGIDEDFAKVVAKDKPLRVVFRDSGFASDTAKINVQQLLKQLSPDTEMKVI